MTQLYAARIPQEDGLYKTYDVKTVTPEYAGIVALRQHQRSRDFKDLTEEPYVFEVHVRNKDNPDPTLTLLKITAWIHPRYEITK